jgi:hypothetical protein
VNERDQLAALQAENERLAALLDSHGINWRQTAIPQSAARDADSIALSPDEKVALFRRLFRGRVDVNGWAFAGRRDRRFPDRAHPGKDRNYIASQRQFSQRMRE